MYITRQTARRGGLPVCVCVYIQYTYTRRNDDNNNNETDIMFVQLMILLLLLSCVCNPPADDRDRGGIFPRGSDQKKPEPAAVVPEAAHCARLGGGLSRVRHARC